MFFQRKPKTKPSSKSTRFLARTTEEETSYSEIPQLTNDQAPLTQRKILQLQHLVGNQAVQRLLHGTQQSRTAIHLIHRLTQSPAANHAQRLIQRAGIHTMGGEWDTDRYDLIAEDPGKRRGIDIKLLFKPNASVDAKKIGLTQNVKSYKDSKPYVINNDQTIKNRMISEDDQWTDHLGESTGGYKHDRMSSKNNPIYGGNDLGGGDELKDTTTGGNAHLGWRYKDGDDEKIENPWLTDGPVMNNADKNSGAVFETTALALEGAQKDTFYGSIKWGWRSDENGNQTKIPLEVISFGAPSPTFIKTAKLWKDNTTSTGGATKGLPTENLIPVYFEVKYASKLGEELYVTGDKPELGNWQPESATKLRYADAQTWKGMVTMNADKAQQNIEYKYLVKKGSDIRWEEGGNHRPGKLPEGGKTASYTDSWDDAN